MTDLEDGFYWVRTSGEWVPAYWSGQYFYVTGDDSGFDPDNRNHIQEIDPRRIVREGGE